MYVCYVPVSLKKNEIVHILIFGMCWQLFIIQYCTQDHQNLAGEHCVLKLGGECCVLKVNRERCVLKVSGNAVY